MFFGAILTSGLFIFIEVFSSKNIHSELQLLSFFSKVKMVPCDQCQLVFSSFFDFLKHSKSSHKKSKIVCSVVTCEIIGYKCTYCGKSFASTEYLLYNQHLMDNPIHKHNGKCDECDFRTSDYNILEEHFSQNHETQQLDEKCHVLIDTEVDSNAHENIVTKKWSNIQEEMEKHFSNYFCDECDYESSDKIKYSLHKKDHHGAELFLCSICNISFLLKSDLLEHNQENHITCKVSFYCNNCNFQATSKSDLVEHVIASVCV